MLLVALNPFMATMALISFLLFSLLSLFHRTDCGGHGHPKGRVSFHSPLTPTQTLPRTHTHTHAG